MLDAFLPFGPLGPKGYCRPFVRRLRRRRTYSFGYYTNMVQQIKFNPPPPGTFFYPR